MSAFPAQLQDPLREGLGVRRISRIHPVAGGSVHRAMRLEADGHSFFLKVASDSAHVRSLEAEVDGLENLRRLQHVRTPEVLAFVHDDTHALLALPWIEKSDRRAGAEAGRHVAALHSHATCAWGHDRDNLIATLEQPNDAHVDGASFWADLRLQPFAERAQRSGALNRKSFKAVEQLATRLRDGNTPRPRTPVQLHGDLWGGNLIIDTSGRSWLIDPAVYAGDPRVDLAMTRLFGGFSRAFHDAWEAELGTRDDDRFWHHAYTVYPLLVHALLFGSGYGAAAAREAQSALQQL